MIGLLYIRRDYNQTAVQNFNALIFLIIINTSFANIFAITQVNILEFSTKDQDDIHLCFFRVTLESIQYFIKIMMMRCIV